MEPRSKLDPWSDFNLSRSGVINERKSNDSTANVKRTDLPFYVSQSQYKTSAEIIEEAKATMTKQGSFPTIRFVLLQGSFVKLN